MIHQSISMNSISNLKNPPLKCNNNSNNNKIVIENINRKNNKVTLITSICNLPKDSVLIRT